MRFNIKKIVAIHLAIIFFIGLDRWLKVFALANQGQGFNLIGEVFKFHYQANYNIAFSLPLAGGWLMVLILLIIIALIWFFVYCYQEQDYARLAPIASIILGASSNLSDRYRYGRVIDYLDLSYFTVFNLADVMIVAGVLIFIIFLYKKKPKQAP
jgi:signal peptidase II